MYLQVVFNLHLTNQSKAAIVEVKAKPSWNYFQIERKVRPQLSKLLGHRDYKILYMYELTEEEYYTLVAKYYKSS